MVTRARNWTYKYVEVHDTHCANQPTVLTTSSRKLYNYKKTRLVLWPTWSVVRNFNQNKNSRNRIFWLVVKMRSPRAYIVSYRWKRYHSESGPSAGSGCLKNRLREVNLSLFSPPCSPRKASWLWQWTAFRQPRESWRSARTGPCWTRQGSSRTGKNWPLCFCRSRAAVASSCIRPTTSSSG